MTMRPVLILYFAASVVGLPVYASPGVDNSGEFRISPPQDLPSERPREILSSNLKDLIDAWGLALFLEEDRAAARLQPLVAAWHGPFKAMLDADPLLQEIDARLAQLFAEGRADRFRPQGEFQQFVSSVPQQKFRPMLRGWLQTLLHNHQLIFPEDLDQLSPGQLEDICGQARTFASLRGLSAWQYRALMWRYRDTEIRRLFAARDERVAFLAPIQLDQKEMDPATRDTAVRFLSMLRNLKLQVAYNHWMPYETFRALDGLMRGLRYMGTVRSACEATGLDHRLMTRLFIQESEFIQQRVSSMGAFSVAQFIDVALKDVWTFRGNTQGGAELLKGISSFDDLKQKVIDDPHTAIRAACLYFRHIRDDVARILQKDKEEAQANPKMVTLLTLEWYASQRGLARQSVEDVQQEMVRVWPAEQIIPLLLLPVSGGVMPDPGATLARWAQRTVQDLVQVRMAQDVYQGRLERLEDALGLAAYNAGVGNLKKSAKKQDPLGGLSFPLQITETRDYIDSILDGRAILERADQMVSGISRLSYEQLVELTERACRKAGIKPLPSAASPASAGASLGASAKEPPASKP